MKESDKNKSGILQRVTGIISNFFAKPAAKGTHPQKASTLRRTSGAGPAVKIPRTAPKKPGTPAALNPPPAPPPPLIPAAKPPDQSHLTNVSFDSFDLPDSVRQGLVDAGFQLTTPIQASTLPLALSGRDVAGQAQTGTGKTAAFLVTTFTRLLKSEAPRVPGSPRAFVIAPTRELVAQIESDAKKLGAHTGFKIHAVYGGVDYGRQRDILKEGVDLLIGTPGRLIDYYKQRVYNLDGVEVLVIDEADRMFDMGFLPDLRYMLRKLPTYDKRQSMLFSATLSYRVMELAYEHMNLPQKIEVAPEQKTADRVEQRLYHVGSHEKFSLLLGLLKRDAGARILIFVNTKVAAEAIVRRLGANGFVGAELSGDIPQNKRIKVLADFKDGTLPILVATDVAARGLHIDGVTHVYNYDIPLDPEDYVHRIGRTARAGASGHAIAFACERYVAGLGPIEAFLGQKLPVDWADDSLFVPEIKAPRPARHIPDLKAEHFGSPRGEHGAGGHARNPSRHSRTDRIERVVGHHPTKELALEAQLEAEGVVFEDAPPSRPASSTPARGAAPSKPGTSRGRRSHGNGGDSRPTPKTTDAESIPKKVTAAVSARPAAADSPAPGGASAAADAPRKRRRRRRGGKKPETAPNGSPVQPQADLEHAPSAPASTTGGFWNPDQH